MIEEKNPSGVITDPLSDQTMDAISSRSGAQRLVNTKVFDAKYYSIQVGSSFESQLSAAESFVSVGMKKGYSLHPLLNLGHFPAHFQQEYLAGDVEAVLQYLLSKESRQHAWSDALDPRLTPFCDKNSRILSKYRPGVDRELQIPGTSNAYPWQDIREILLNHEEHLDSLRKTERLRLRDALTSGQILPCDHDDKQADKSVTTETPENARQYVGAVDYWARQLIHAKHRNWFINQAKKTRSVGARDVLAHSGTKGAYRFHDLSLILESIRIDLYRKGAVDRLRSTLWKPGFRGLARVLFCQRLTPYDLQNALTIYRTLIQVFGQSALEDVDRSYYQDLLVETGLYAEAQNVFTTKKAMSEARQLDQRMLHLNAINPGVTGKSEKLQDWLDGLNEIYAERGFAAVNLRPGLEPAFFRLSSHAVKRVGQMPLVSIIMPIFEPDESTDAAIRSLLNQTWTNLELIIVDDGSPRVHPDGSATGYVQQLEEWQKKDTRIKLILNNENRGAYWARNTGYEVASGMFVTVADKDDWHHPQKIEFQAQNLLDNDDSIVNMTNWVRADQDLRFLLRWGPDRVIHPSFASIMFYRAEIKKELGYWDNVRKSGDGEFKFRLQAVYGINLQPEEPAPLAISLIGDGNLTSLDLGLGFEHPDRRWYKRSYDEWHREISEGTASHYLSRNPEERPFLAPNGFLPDRREEDSLDVVYLSEFGFAAGNTTVLRNEIKSAVEAGLKVGILPVSNFLISSAAIREVDPEIESLVLNGNIKRVSSTSHINVKLLVIRWPAVLEFTRDAPSSIHADQVLIIANHMPYEKNDDRQSYDITRVTDTARHMFGNEPVWVPESERVLEVLRPLVPASQLSVVPWKGILSDEWHTVPRTPIFGEKPVIGRHARDHVTKWPSNRIDLLSVYPVDGSVGVSILGGASTPLAQGLLTEAESLVWTVQSFNGVPVREYLEGIDFFVYFPHEDLKEAYGMAIVEAMAAGIVCILPEDFRPVFGDAARYANIKEVQSVVIELWSEQTKYLRQQECGLDFVRETASPKSYIRMLESYGVSSVLDFSPIAGLGEVGDDNHGMG